MHNTNAEIGRICGFINWVGITTRNEYRYEPITATRVMLNGLSTTKRWHKLEMKFALFSSKMSENVV